MSLFCLYFSVCESSQWNCTDEECAGWCSATGSKHYETFDGNRFNFYGDCSYVLAEDICEDQVGSFVIIIENIPCHYGDVICSKSVKVKCFCDAIITKLLHRQLY